MRDDFDLTPALEVERELQRLSVELNEPLARECLLCYVYRMLEFGCTGLGWALHYRDTRAPRATALPDRLPSRGAGCDCEIFMNGYRPRTQYLVVDEDTGERDYPETMPPCRGFDRARPGLVACGRSGRDPGTSSVVSARFPRRHDTRPDR